MSDKKHNALRIAAVLDVAANALGVSDDDDEIVMAAAELRRLHALCDELGEALGNAHSELKSLARAPDSAYAKPDRECIYEIEVALDKWKESK